MSLADTRTSVGRRPGPADSRRMRRPLLTLSALLAAAAFAPAALAHEGPHAATVEGTLRAWHGDTFARPVSFGAGIDTIVGGMVELEQAPATISRLVGKRVRAGGVRDGAALAVSGGVQAVGATIAVAAATGTKSVAVLLFNFAGDTRSPGRPPPFATSSSTERARSTRTTRTRRTVRCRSAARSSAGSRSTPRTPAATARPGPARLARRPRPRESRSPATPTPCTRSRTCPAVGWAGLAYLPGTSSWINGSMNLRVVGHELGHNFGVHHASTLACTNAGASVVRSSTVQRERVRRPVHDHGLGVDAPPQQLASRAARVDADADGLDLGRSTRSRRRRSRRRSPRLLRVARGDGTYLNLEFRQPSGAFDDFSAGRSGSHGRLGSRRAGRARRSSQSQLIDANPGDDVVRRLAVRSSAVVHRSRLAT